MNEILCRSVPGTALLYNQIDWSQTVDLMSKWLLNLEDSKQDGDTRVAENSEHSGDLASRGPRREHPYPGPLP